MKIKLFSVANILTLINAFCGCCAVVFVIQGYASEAIYFTMISLVADFFDGFAARKMGDGSELGKQLDSLADMISFGVVPSAIFYSLLKNYTLALDVEPIVALLLPVGAFVLTTFALLRLGKFNIDYRQGEDFIGLATPAMTLFVVGYLAICNGSNEMLSKLLQNICCIIATIILLCILMIAEIPMFSLKFKNYQWKSNSKRFIFLAISLVLLLVFQVQALALIILIYILISIIQYFFTHKSHHSETT